MTKRLRYIYHGYVQIAEIDATDETAPYVTKTYRWTPTATRPLALSLWTREGTVRETLYYAHDLRKNVVSLFDANGLRRASYQYDPYGNITSIEGDMAESNPYRFSSEHHDEDLGLVYYNYRWAPSDGRWISRDPIAEKGGVNLYGFVLNNPHFYTDFTGLLTIIVHGTWASQEEWWRPNGDFAKSVDSIMQDVWKISSKPIPPFSWSGDCSHEERVKAGKKLAEYIERIRKQYPDEEINLVGHSHGGNVVLEALKILYQNHQNEEPFINQVVLIATPQMSYPTTTKSGTVKNNWYYVDLQVLEIIIAQTIVSIYSVDPKSSKPNDSVQLGIAASDPTMHVTTKVWASIPCGNLGDVYDIPIKADASGMTGNHSVLHNAIMGKFVGYIIYGANSKDARQRSGLPEILR